MSLLLRTFFVAAGLAIAGCAISAPSAEAPIGNQVHTKPKSNVQSAPIRLDLKSGQVLQFALIREREGDAAKAVRERYFKTAVPHAASLGDEYLGNLRIKDTLIGKNKPRAVAIWAFPDVAAQDKFRASPKWPEYVEMRQAGWEELHVYSAVVPKDITITFDQAKDYTLAAGWARPNTMDDYDRYLDGIEADFDQIGANYLARFTRIDLQSSVEAVASPTHLTLVEWSGGPNLDGLRNTKAYQDNAENFSTAISRFDLYWVHFPIPPRGTAQ